MTEKIYPIAIIGSGSAGTMATLRSILNNDECLLLPGNGKNRKKSRAFWVAKIENMPDYNGYKKGIADPGKNTLKWIEESEFAGNLTIAKNRGVKTITKLTSGDFKLTDDKDEEYLAKNIILCTGVMDIQPEIAGTIAPLLPYANVQMVDYCLRCDGHHTYGKETSVIGHNSGAAWVAVMLYERYKNPSMTILTHGEEPQFDENVKALVEKYNIKIVKDKIIGVRGNAKELNLEGYELENGEFFASEFSFVSLGMIVYNELALQVGAEVDDRGFVLTDGKGKTSIDGLYVAGDLRAGIKNQIYTAWDSAVDSADAINGKLRQAKR